MNDFVAIPDLTREPMASQARFVTQAGLVTTSASHASAPSHDDIARRAYDIYEKKGRKQGECQQNWQRAESELRDPSATAGCCEPHEAERAGSQQLVRTIVDVMPSNKNGRGTTRGNTAPVRTAGHETNV